MSEYINQDSKINDDIDIKEIFLVCWNQKILLSLITSIFAIGSIFYSLSLSNIYISSSLLSPAKGLQSESSSADSSTFGSLASLAGMGFSSYGSKSGEIARETILSRDFFKHLISFDSILPKLVASKSYDTNSGSIIFDTNLYDPVKKSWVAGEPHYLDAYKIYRQIVKCNLDRRTNFVELSIAHKSPIFAEELVSLIVREINLLQRERDILESQSSLEYLYEQFNNVMDIDIKLSINQLIEGQLKTQMLAKVRTHYILEPIDEPFIPKEKSSPSRLRIVVLATIVGLLAGIVFVVGRHFFFNSEKKENT